MTDPTLEEIARRAEAATDGEWIAKPLGDVRLSACPDREFISCYGPPSNDFDEAKADLDAAFIANARTDIPYLLSRLREAEARVGRLREALRPFAKLADMTPIMAGRGENTRHRNPKDDEHFDWSSNVTWGMLRRARAALDEKEKG